MSRAQKLCAFFTRCFLSLGYDYLVILTGRKIYFIRSTLQDTDFEVIEAGKEAWLVEVQE